MCILSKPNSRRIREKRACLRDPKSNLRDVIRRSARLL